MIEIRYKCRCMRRKETVEVRNRQPGEDIAHWVGEVVAYAVGDAHRLRSPGCRRSKMEYVQIPAPKNAPYIGGEPKLDS